MLFKNNSNDKKNYITKKADKKNKKKKRNKILKTIFTIMVLFILVVLGLFVGFVVSILSGAGELSKADFEINKFTTFIYDKNGEEFATINSGENRTYASLLEVSPYLPEAFISIEDERFKQHFGIDIKRTAGAVFRFFTGNSSYGGSTITQQLVKKVTEDDARDWTRKVREIVRAIQLEQWLSKDQIIELYMNIIYLGEGAYGVETAARTYFDKSASELSIAECAFIAGLAQAPEGYNPYGGEAKLEKGKTRQLLVLKKMNELGKINNEQYEEAKNEELVFKKGVVQASSSNSYFVDAVVEKVIDDLQKQKGVTRAMAQKMIYNNGYKIYTTVDPKVQKALEDVYTDNSYFKTSDGNYDPDLQSAMVVFDYKNGSVAGLVGGAGEKSTLRGLNRATQITRAPGSNIKPLAVYAAGLEKGVLTAATVYDDIPITRKIGSKVWNPKNYDNRYRGLSNIRKAIMISMNVMAVKAFEDVGADYSFEFLKNLGITSLTANDRYPAALSLGGLTKGISPIEMVAAYGTIANGGVYNTPKLYTKVVDKYGDTIIECKTETRNVMSKANAFIMTSMMEDVVTGSEGTARVTKIDGIDTAGKTGTTSDSKDRWYSGYTPYYAASVWVGYDKQKTISTSVNPSAKLWKAVMAKVHEGLPSKSFQVPSGVVKIDVCRDSGLLPTENCKHDRRGDRTYSEYFTTSTIPTRSCSVHVTKAVCPDTYKLANPTCLSTVGTVEQVFLNRGYETEPSRLPEDYNYEVPKDYCTFHYCPQDENGNWITTPIPFGVEEDVDEDDTKNNNTGLVWWN